MWQAMGLRPGGGWGWRQDDEFAEPRSTFRQVGREGPQASSSVQTGEGEGHRPGGCPQRLTGRDRQEVGPVLSQRSSFQD